MAKIAVIGHGTIGQYAAEVAPRYGHKVALIVRRAGISAQGKTVRKFKPRTSPKQAALTVAEECVKRGVKFALLAIPSGGSGETEAAYITALASRGIRVVTAGKSALANQFDAVAPYLSSIGYDATVGGGTMIPSFLQDHLYVDPAHPFVLTLVINGTLNYAQSCVLEGISKEQICNEAVRLGFAEPPEKGKKLTPYDMYCGELGDISRKIAVICNTMLLELTGRVVNQRDFTPTEFTTEDQRRVIAGNSTYRYLVRFCMKHDDLEFFNDIEVGGMIKETIGDVYIAAGFVPLSGALKKWVPDYVGNAAHLVQNGDTDIKIGQGAGPVPTVGTMYSNLRRFEETV